MIAENKANTAIHEMAAMAQSTNEVVTVPLDCGIGVQDVITVIC